MDKTWKITVSSADVAQKSIPAIGYYTKSDGNLDTIQGLPPVTKSLAITLTADTAVNCKKILCNGTAIAPVLWYRLQRAIRRNLPIPTVLSV